MIGLIFCGICLLLLYIYLRPTNIWESKGIPNDKPFLFFGSFYRVGLRKENLFERLIELYNQLSGPICGFYIFTKPVLMVRNPELIKLVLVKDFDKFTNRDFDLDKEIDPLAYHALFFSKSAEWKAMRSKLTPVFTSGKLKLMLPLIKECADDLNLYLIQHTGEMIEMRNVIRNYTIDVISSCAFGIRADCIQDGQSEIRENAIKIVDQSGFIRNFSMIAVFFMPSLAKLLRLTFADWSATKFLIDLFESVKRQRQNRQIVRNDFIDLLYNLKNTEHLDLDWSLASQAVAFFSAGNDTSAFIIAYTLHELAVQPELQDRLRAEIRQILHKHGELTYTAIQDMKYLNMVVSETLRMYPLTLVLQRECSTKYTFPETGVTIDEKTSILIPVAGLHFDRKYFPEPNKFNPERFSDENKDAIPSYVYMPFGEGPRNCIGSRLALLVVKVALINVINKFSLHTCKNTDIPIKFQKSSTFLQSLNISLKVDKI